VISAPYQYNRQSPFCYNERNTMLNFANMHRVFSADFIALCKSFDTIFAMYGDIFLVVIVFLLCVVVGNCTFSWITANEIERDEMRRNGLL
jgi:hypothetical protein